MNVSLTPELEQFVQSKVESGMYYSASEVIREGLRMLQEKEMLKQIKIEELRREIQKGIEQADRGELVDGEEVFENIRAKSRTRRNKKV
ncbi:MAG: type II toxin-antitoxin system ParD family antitoxin [Cyanobacteria bacterium P01_F01_bin.143]